MLMEEQFRLEEERAVASLQRASQDRARALEKVACLEVRAVSLVDAGFYIDKAYHQRVDVMFYIGQAYYQTVDVMFNIAKASQEGKITPLFVMWVSRFIWEK